MFAPASSKATSTPSTTTAIHFELAIFLAITATATIVDNCLEGLLYNSNIYQNTMTDANASTGPAAATTTKEVADVLEERLIDSEYKIWKKNTPYL